MSKGKSASFCLPGTNRIGQLIRVNQSNCGENHLIYTMHHIDLCCTPGLGLAMQLNRLLPRVLSPLPGVYQFHAPCSIVHRLWWTTGSKLLSYAQIQVLADHRPCMEARMRAARGGWSHHHFPQPHKINTSSTSFSTWNESNLITTFDVHRSRITLPLEWWQPWNAEIFAFENSPLEHCNPQKFGSEFPRKYP